jgi:hypothetical protein
MTPDKFNMMLSTQRVRGKPPTLPMPDMEPLEGVIFPSSLDEYLILYNVPSKAKQARSRQAYADEIALRQRIEELLIRKVQQEHEQRARDKEAAAILSQRIAELQARSDNENTRLGNIAQRIAVLNPPPPPVPPPPPRIKAAAPAGTAVPTPAEPDYAKQLSELATARAEAAARYIENIEHVKRIQQDILDNTINTSMVRDLYDANEELPHNTLAKIFKAIGDYEKTIKHEDKASDFGPLFRVDRNTNKGIAIMPKCWLTIDPSADYPPINENHYARYLRDVDRIKQDQTKISYGTENYDFQTWRMGDILKEMLSIVSYEKTIPPSKMHPDRQPSSLTGLLTNA